MSEAAENVNRRLLRARDVMDRRYSDPLSIDDLAGVALIAPTHFIREFKRVFGEPPYRYLIRLSIADLLGEVGDEVGLGGEVGPQVGLSARLVGTPGSRGGSGREEPGGVDAPIEQGGNVAGFIDTALTDRVPKDVDPGLLTPVRGGPVADSGELVWPGSRGVWGGPGLQVDLQRGYRGRILPTSSQGR